MFNLLSPLIGGLTSGGIRGVVKRTKIQAACWGIICIAAIFCVGFSCLLSYLWIREFASPIMSAAILFGFWLLVAVIALIVMKILSARQNYRHKQEMAQERTRLLVSSALAAIPTAFTINKKFALASAVPLLGIALLAMLNHTQNTDEEE